VTLQQNWRKKKQKQHIRHIQIEQTNKNYFDITGRNQFGLFSCFLFCFSSFFFRSCKINKKSKIKNQKKFKKREKIQKIKITTRIIIKKNFFKKKTNFNFKF